MSSDVFPELPTQVWPIEREPFWPGTHIEETINGREFRSTSSTYPLQNLTVRYSALDFRRYEAQRLIDFYNSRAGGFDSFLFRDRDDDRVTLQQLATTNGVTTQYQIGRAISNLPMNLLDFSGAPLSGWTLSELTASLSYPSRDTLDAALLVESATATVTHDMTQSAVPVLPGLPFTWLAKMLPAGRTKVRLVMLTADGATSVGSADIDLNSGAFSLTGTATDAGVRTLADGMRLVWVTATTQATQIAARARVRLLNAGGSSSYTGDGVSGLHVADLGFHRGPFIGEVPRNNGAVPPVQFLAPIFDLAGAPSIYLADATGINLQSSGYTVSATGLLTFSGAPGSGKALLWSGGFYHRCRFLENNLTTAQFTRQLFATQSVKLRTVKP